MQRVDMLRLRAEEKIGPFPPEIPARIPKSKENGLFIHFFVLF